MRSSSALAARTVRQVAEFGPIVYGIMGAVFFTLVLLTGNAIGYTARERTPEWATMKTVGFSNRAMLAVVLGESVLLLALGALAEFLLAHAVVVGVNLRSGPQVPLAPVAELIRAQGLTLAVLVGLLAGALPAVRAARQSVTAGLRNLQADRDVRFARLVRAESMRRMHGTLPTLIAMVVVNSPRHPADASADS